MLNVSVVILAAGKGTRMKNRTPKVLRLLRSKPIIYWTLKTVQSLKFKEVIVVIGNKARQVQKFINNAGFDVTFVKLEKFLGTAYSVRYAIKKVRNNCKTVLILFGDDRLYIAKKL